jgi:hypothetical protein
MSATKQRENFRKNDFKKKETQASKNKRAETLVRIRKEQRENNLQKRRLVREEDNTVLESPNPNQSLETLVAAVRSNEPYRQLDGITRFRKLLSIEKNPPIQQTIDSGVVPRFVEFLSMETQHQIQFEACWALTNIASGSSDQTRFVIDAGAVPRFKELLLSSNEDVREQAIWALGNIAGDSSLFRDYILSQGVLEPLLLSLVDSHRISMLRNATWALSNLCRGKPQPPWHIVSGALPTLARLLHSTDDEVLADACWALSYLSDGPNERIQAILDTNIARRMVELLIHPSFSVQTPALRMVGNIVTGDDAQTQTILNASVLPCLLTLLVSPRKTIRKESCWTISNITAGNRNQVQAVIDAQIIPRLVYLLKNSEFEIKKEAAWALSNATSCASYEQIQYMVECNIIDPMCDLLGSSDAKIVLVGLEALDNILKAGDKESFNEYTTQVEECHGLDKLEVLQSHPQNDVYEKAVSILEKYFAAEEDQNISPNIIGGNYAFGTAVSKDLFDF